MFTSDCLMMGNMKLCTEYMAKAVHITVSRGRKWSRCFRMDDAG